MGNPHYTKFKLETNNFKYRCCLKYGATPFKYGEKHETDKNLNNTWKEKR